MSKIQPVSYQNLAVGISSLLENARRASARAVNSIMTATYWEIGHRIVEFEQGGKAKAEYGEQLIHRLSQDLTARFGRGFGPVNLSQMKRFYLTWSSDKIFQTASENFPPKVLKAQTLSAQSAASNAVLASSLSEVSAAFPLPWSHYVRLLW